MLAVICSTGVTRAQDEMLARYTRPLHDVMANIEQRFGVRFKYNVDTVGLKLPYADFRVRPYSLEETLDNVCKYFDFNWWRQDGNLIKIKPYEYPRRHDEDGGRMLSWLNTLYDNRSAFESRRDSVRREVRQLLQYDLYHDSLVRNPKVTLSKVRHYDGYAKQNICIETLPGEHVFGTLYLPEPDKATLKRWKAGRGGSPLSSDGRGYPLIVCPDGHFNGGRYRKDEQQRLATLARMGAMCVDFDLYAWGESETEHATAEHRSDRAHVMQVINAEVLLGYLLAHRKDIDRSRLGVNGGSGGGTHTVLLTVLDDRFTAAAPTVNLASHFDGGCPCESGKPIQLAGGGTCNPELAAFFAPRPMLVVSDGGDWTHTVPSLEFPYLQRVYGFYNAKDKVENVHLPKERHDFGPNKRQAVYDFFIRTFRLDSSLLDESKVAVESPEQMMTRP